MSKSVLIVDTPESCWKCSLRNANECIVAEKTITRREYGKRQEWCPLQDLPRRKMLLGLDGASNAVEIRERGRQEGFNACIDEILEGESEK